MSHFYEALEHEFRRHKGLADRALEHLDDAMWFRQPTPHVNSVAVIVKHLAGNLRSRWNDFLSTDGEKPERNRDGEFVLTSEDTREVLLTQWERGWNVLFETLGNLTEADMGKTITIRGEPHTVVQALLRGLDHAAYHVGQVMYLARWLKPDAPWQTIPPGQSQSARPGYLTR